ncbi:hypothetical protein ABPG75_005114 [Micractinium tetrahymenae]
MAAARVISVPLVEKTTRWAPPSQEAMVPPPTMLDCTSRPAGTPLVFELEGFPDVQSAVEPVSLSAQATRATVERLLAAGPDSAAIHSAVLEAVQAGCPDLQATAAALERMGWSTRVCSSRGGTLRQLRHTFLIATHHRAVRGEPAEWVVDPSFGQAFRVAHPTPRYAHILEAVPPLAVAPLPRLLRAVLLLGSELERCFERRGLPLPPWRSTDALVSRYEAAVHSSLAVTAAAAAAAGRATKQRLQLAGEGGVPVASASPPSALSGARMDVDSPTSIVEVAQGLLSRAFGASGKAPEWFCSGWRAQHSRSWRAQQYQHQCVACAA